MKSLKGKRYWTVIRRPLAHELWLTSQKYTAWTVSDISQVSQKTYVYDTWRQVQRKFHIYICPDILNVGPPNFDLAPYHLYHHRSRELDSHQEVFNMLYQFSSQESSDQYIISYTLIEHYDKFQSNFRVFLYVKSRIPHRHHYQ